MSESARDELTVSDREFTVRKSLNTEQFETLAVVFDIRSSRNMPTRIQVSDTVPDNIPMDDIGFHPEYGGDHWAIDGDRVVFERSFDPGEEYTTIYGIRDLEVDDADGLMTEPSIDIINDPEEGVVDIEGIDDIVDQESTEAVREVISGERDALPGMETGVTGSAPAEEPPAADQDDEAVTIDAEDIEPPEEPVAGDDALADDPALGEAAAADEPADAATADQGGPEPAAGDDSILPEEDEPLVDAEADEVDDVPATDAESPFSDEEGSLIDSDEPLLGEPEEDEAEAVEGADLVADAPDLDADAAPSDSEPTEQEPAMADDTPLEEPDEGELSDEAPADEPEAEEAEDELTVPVTGGVARVLAKELREGNVSDEDRELLRDELAYTEGSTETRIEHLQSRVSDLEAYTDALEAFIDQEGHGQAVLDKLRESLDGLEDDVSRVESKLASNTESIDVLRDDLHEVEDEIDDFGEEISDVDEQVSGLEDAVDDFRDDLDRLEGVESRTDSLEDDLDQIHDHLEELDAFRTRLSSVFGGGESDEA